MTFEECVNAAAREYALYCLQAAEDRAAEGTAQ